MRGEDSGEIGAYPRPSGGRGGEVRRAETERGALRADLDGRGGFARADEAAIVAALDAVRADAPIGAGVAIDPRAPADRLAALAGDRHRFLLGPVEQVDLVVARPHRLAAVELDRHRAGMLVLEEEGHAVGGGGRGEEKGDEGKANHAGVPVGGTTMAWSYQGSA